MKIKSLRIHNIASIADAYLDFEAQPLSDADIFLITGNTGAGKSTILDCICLALYNTAPRLKSTLMEGRLEQKGDYNGISLSDPRQLLRRNAGEGFAELVFEGNNGLVYIARWSAQRAYSRPGGRLQKIVHTFVCGDRTFTGDTLREERLRAVGMGYDEFVRTTMLAQGEFTRFLNCSDKEKADVLMQILNVDIYERISRGIHLRTSAEKEILERLQTRADSLDLLSPEQSEALAAEKSTLGSRVAELRAAVDTDTAKARWFAESAALAGRLSVATRRLAEAEALCASPLIARRATFLADYDSSTELLALLQQAFDTRKSLIKCKLRNDELADEYVSCRAALAAMELQSADIERQMAENSRWFEMHAPYAHTVERHLLVARTAKNYHAASLRLTANTSRLAELMKEMDIRLAELAKAREEAAKAAAIVDSERQQAARLDRQLKEMNTDALREKEQTLAARAAALAIVGELAGIVSQRRQERDAAASRLATLSASLPDALSAVEKAETESVRCNGELESRRKIFEKASQSMSDWCRRIRSELSVGDVCPVCSRRIEHALGSDDEILRALEPLRLAVDEARTSAFAATEALNAARVALTTRHNLIAGAKEDVRRCEEALAAASVQFDSRCAALAVAPDSIDYAAALCAEERKALQPMLEEARMLRESCEAQRVKVDAAVAARERADALMKRVADSIAGLDARKASLEALIASEKEQMEEFSSALAVDVRGPWKSLWSENLRDFLDELDAAVAARRDAEEKSEALTLSRERLASSIAVCRNADADILALRPAWCRENAEFRPVARPEAEYPALKARTEANIEAESTLSAQYTQLKALVNEKFASGAQKSVLALCRMLRVSADELQSVRREVENARTALSEARGACENIRREQEALLAARPAMSDEENADTVGERLKVMAAETEVCMARLAVIDETFRRDRELRERQADILAQIEAQKNVLASWVQLDGHFGSADGRRFSKIALRYVLGHLLEKANVYLQRIMPRYRLHCRRDSFIIMVEDAYQNGAMRSANVISGGESFIVSLVLALALSDVGTRLKVDILFIDEGFGSLSGDALESAVDTLRSLHSQGGRRVGIISHVAELRERIPVKILVTRQAQSPSTVTVHTS